MAVNTRIGQGLGRARSTAAIALALSACVLAADFTLILLDSATDAARAALAAGALSALLAISKDRRRSLGLVLGLRPGYVYWIKATLVIGAIVGAFVGAASLAVWALSIPVQYPMVPPWYVRPALLHMCAVAPLIEETLYRAVLCAPLAAVLGPRWTILLGGAVFAALHFAYGNPGPDNMIAGFFFTWAYLKSGSLFTPIVLHSLGNGVALATQVANWWIIME